LVENLLSTLPIDGYIAQSLGENMVDVVVVYWRDIPAQVIVGKGRAASKVQLPERFEQAIDRCAMKIGAKDADAYLAEWRKAAPYSLEGEAGAVASAEAARLDAEYDAERIKALIAAEGWAQ
jgi:hypothetical protein